LRIPEHSITEIVEPEEEEEVAEFCDLVANLF
jgi:hypothetical protein